MTSERPVLKIGRGRHRYWRQWGGVCHCYLAVCGVRESIRYESLCGKSGMPGRMILSHLGAAGKPICRPPLALRCPDCASAEPLLAPGLKLKDTCDEPVPPMDPDRGW